MSKINSGTSFILYEIFRNFLRVILFLIYLVKYLFTMSLVYLKVLVLNSYVWRHTKKQSKLGVIDPLNPEVVDVIKVDYKKSLNFIYQRVPSYLYAMSIGMIDHILDFIFQKLEIQVLSDRDLQFLLVSTAIANQAYIKHNWIIFPFYDFEKLHVYPNFYFHVREIRIYKDYSKMEVKMYNFGTQKYQIYHWCESEENHHVDWNLIKLHIQCAINADYATRCHNFVHFHLPSIFSTGLDLITSETQHSVLKTMLKPHLEHNESINYLALHIGNSLSCL